MAQYDQEDFEQFLENCISFANDVERYYYDDSRVQLLGGDPWHLSIWTDAVVHGAWRWQKAGKPDDESSRETPLVDSLGFMMKDLKSVDSWRSMQILGSILLEQAKWFKKNLT